MSQANACGKEDYEDVEQLEIIFDEAAEIGSIDCMYRLRSLTMIMNNLQRISGLNNVASTLQHLCLCDQEISIMENLSLPFLRELLLHRNKIVAIAGLQGCPRLRKLWLFSNRISRIEELHHCGFLTELWLQDNQIETIEGLDSLVSLRQLELAGNRIASIEQLQRLSVLPALSELSFKDIHFGDCPVTTKAGYREAVACYLKQVTRLDGVEIAQDEERAATAARNEQIAMFNQALDELELEYRRQLLELERKRAANEAHAATFEKEMQTAMRELETLVADGRERMQREVKRYNDICRANLRHLHARVNQVAAEAEAQLKLLADEERAKLARTEMLFDVLEAVTIAEARMDDAADAINRENEPVFACRPLDEHTPDYHMLMQDIRARSAVVQQQWQQFAFDAVEAVRVYRLVPSQLPAVVAARSSSSGRLPRARLFHFVLPIEMLQRVAVRGLGELRQPLVLYDSLEMAVAVDSAFYGQAASVSAASDALEELSTDINEQGDYRPPQQRSASTANAYVAVTCTVSGITREERLAIDLDELQGAPLELRKRLMEFPFASVVRIETDSMSSPSGDRLLHSPRSHGAVCVAIPASEISEQILSLENCVLCVPVPAQLDLSSLEDILDGISQPQVPAFEEIDIFQRFQTSIQTEVQNFREQILEQVDPATAERLREADRAIATREDSVQRLRNQIDSERQAQEAIIREARLAVSARQQQGQLGAQSRSQQAYLAAKSRTQQRPSKSATRPQHRQRPRSASHR